MVEQDSVLHVVAAAGDSLDHLRCASMIYAKDRHLLTMAAPSSKGDTPLHCAARAGNTKMVAHLIKLAAEGSYGGPQQKVAAMDFVRMQNRRGETALHEAVRFGDLEMVEALVSADKRLASVDAKDGTSPMYVACTLGRTTMAIRLHDIGYEPSYSGPRGQNALHAAVLRDKRGTITELLLQWNKDLVKQTDVDGSTPLHFAASATSPFLQFTVPIFSMSINISYAAWIFSVLPSRSMLKKKCEQLGRPVIQLLAADSTCAFLPDRHGSFPVHTAASADCMVSLLVLLIRHPACARLQNAEGKTFLHVAVEKKRLSIVKFICLLWRGKPLIKSIVNIQDDKGDTALHLAVRAGDMDLFRLLIGNKDIQMNLENNEGKTPMDLAAGGVQSGLYFGLSAPWRIRNILTLANAQTGNRRRDLAPEYSPRLDVDEESQKIKDLAQIVGIGSVLVATATFTAALTMPGGVWSPGEPAGNNPPAGTPVLAGSFAFDGFVISNTVAFICSTLATFSLVYCGVAAVDISQRLQMVTFALALLLCSARCFCAALAFALYMLLANVVHGTAIASIVMTSLSLLDGVMFLLVSLRDLMAIFPSGFVLKYGPAFIFLNILYSFWPYLVIGGYLLYDFQTGGNFHSSSRH
ncbi:hypothetical protein EJB05_36247, partial [Eragrostis curvula]